MKGLLGARPRISEKLWLLLIVPLLWIILVAGAHEDRQSNSSSHLIEKAQQ